MLHDGSRLIAITLAKSGTHLLLKTLEGTGLHLGYVVPYAYHQGIQLHGGVLADDDLRRLYGDMAGRLAAISAPLFAQGHLPHYPVHVDLLTDSAFARSSSCAIRGM